MLDMKMVREGADREVHAQAHTREPGTRTTVLLTRC